MGLLHATSRTPLGTPRAWAEAGEMKVPRGRPGASVVSLEDVIEYATDCETKELPLPSKDMQIGGALGVAIFVCCLKLIFTCLR